MSEKYLTVRNSFRSTFEISKSVFITSVCHVESFEQATAFIDEVRSEFADATHNCYAFIADDKGLCIKYSDAGEPQGTAGMPILSVLKSKKLFQVAVVVTRYFGGIKLGAGGLVRAYSTATAEALEQAGIVEKKLCTVFIAKVSYTEFSRIEKLFNADNIVMLDKEYADEVSVSLAIEKDMFEDFKKKLIEFTNGKISVQMMGEQIIWQTYGVFCLNNAEIC